MTLLPSLVVGRKFFSAEIGMTQELPKKITTNDLRWKKYLMIPLFLSYAITSVTSEDIKPLQNHTHFLVSSAATKKAQDNTLIVKRRIGLDGNFISGETISTQILGKCYNALTDDFSGAQFILSKKQLIIKSPDPISSYTFEFMSTKAYVKELLKITGLINVNYNMIEIEGGAIFEKAFKDEKSSISLFQIGYEQYKSIELNQNKLQRYKYYSTSKFIHPAAKKDKATLDDFISTHGNYYVNKVSTGVFAVRQVKFDFGSEEAKVDVEAYVTGKIDLKALKIEFIALFEKADQATKDTMNISVKQGTIGGRPELLQVDFSSKDFDTIESQLLTSWNNFFLDSSKNRENASALSAELMLISSAVHVFYSRTQDETANLHRKYNEARKRINDLQAQMLGIDMALKRTKFMIEALGEGRPGNIRELLRPLKSMGDDFKTYQLDEVLIKFEDYLSLGENHILNNRLPKDELSDGVDIYNPDENWLKDKDLTLDFETTEDIFTLLEGAGRIQGKIDTYTNVLIDGPVAWGEPAGVPNELLFYYKTDDLEKMNTQEKNSKWVFKYLGEQWNPFTGMPRIGSFPIPRTPRAEDIKFENLPGWFGNQKYFMTKVFYSPARTYTGFWRGNEFHDEGVLENNGFKGNSFYSCDVKWYRDYHIHFAKALVLTEDVVYTGDVKYDDVDMIFTMHGDGKINYKNGAVDKGTWSEGKIIIYSLEELYKLQPYLQHKDRYRLIEPEDPPSTAPSTTNEGLCVPLQFLGEDPTGVLKHCQGDCDADSDCEDGTVCFQRQAGESVPGCAGNPTSDTDDYCVRGEDYTHGSSYFYGGPHLIERSKENEPHTILVDPPTDYILSFTIEPLSTATSLGKGSIIYLSGIANIWFDAGTTKLKIRVNSNPPAIFHDLRDDLAIGKKHDVIVTAHGDLSTVSVNGVILSQVTAPPRAKYARAEVYVGFYGDQAANSLISDILFAGSSADVPTFQSSFSFDQEIFSLHREDSSEPNGKLLAEILVPPKEFVLKFSFRVVRFQTYYSTNIVQITSNHIKCPSKWNKLLTQVNAFYYLPDYNRDDDDRDDPFNVDLLVNYWTGNDVCNSPGKSHTFKIDPIRTFRKFDVILSVSKTMSTLLVDGAIVSQQVISTAIDQFPPMGVYVGEGDSDVAVSDIDYR